MRHGLKIMLSIFVVIAAIVTAALTAHSIRPAASEIAAPAIAYTANGEITVDSQLLQRFTLYSDGKGSRAEVRTSFDRETGQQTQVEKAWHTSDKGGFRQKNNGAELYYLGVSATVYPPAQYHRALGKEERQFFGLPAFFTQNDKPEIGDTFESWWSPDLGTVIRYTEGKDGKGLEIKLVSVQLGQPDTSVFALPSLPLRYDDHDKFIRFIESRGDKDEADKQRMAQQATRQKYGDFLKLQ